MKKSDREIVFNKYRGKCAYCGCLLQKSWHVDEIEPCVRKRKYIKAHWDDRDKPLCDDEGDYKNPKYRQWVEGRWVADGYEHIENLRIDNQFPSCASCNINKHSMSLEGFRNAISGFMKHLNEVNTQYKIAKRYGLVIEDIKPIVFHFESLKSE